MKNRVVRVLTTVAAGASLSLEDVETVELIRGMTPAKYGNTLGGLVNITTAEDSDQRRTEMRISSGSLETWDVRGTHSGVFGPANYSVSAGHYETDGYLRNAFVDRDMVSAKLGFSLPLDVTLSTGVRYTDMESGMIVYNMPDAWDYDPGEPDSFGAQLGGPYVSFRQSHTGPLDWGDGSYWRVRRWSTQGDLTSPGRSFLAKMDSYVDVDARVSYPVYRDRSDRVIRVEVAGDNLLDEEIVEEYGYPMPGTIVMAGMRGIF